MAQASSSFTGANENPLSEGGVWNAPGLATAMQRLNNACSPGSAGGNQPMARRVSPSFGSSQFSQCTITTLSGEMFVATRIQGATNASCYALYVSETSADFWLLTDNGSSLSFTQVGSSLAGGASGDVIRLESQGSSHRYYRNGVLQQTFTDPTLSGGQPGLGGDATTPTSLVLDDWSGGDLAQTPTVADAVSVSDLHFAPG